MDRTGRIRKPEARKPGEHTSVSMRMTSDLWHRIDQVAKAAGHSFSHEVEQRLHASFVVDDSLAGPSQQVIKHVIAAWGTGTNPQKPGPYLDAMIRAIGAMTDRYPGGLSPTKWDLIANAIRRRIAAADEDLETILTIWDEVPPAGEDEEKPARRRKA